MTTDLILLVDFNNIEEAEEKIAEKFGLESKIGIMNWNSYTHVKILGNHSWEIIKRYEPEITTGEYMVYKLLEESNIDDASLSIEQTSEIPQDLY